MLFFYWKAYQATAMGCHEIDVCRCDFFCCHDKVCFVLALSTVCNDNHFSCFDVCECLFECHESFIERRFKWFCMSSSCITKSFEFFKNGRRSRRKAKKNVKTYYFFSSFRSGMTSQI